MAKKHSAAISLAAAGLAVTMVQPASAAIKCSNGFQLVDGAMLSTPYCRDNLVAAVARQYGFNAPDAKVRNNPNFKRHVCRFVGQDIRIKEACDEVNPNGRGRF
ncbi:hypothetical protein HYPDE_35533 [Hyphomicrobium denitrificans 1NES1]|jgi:hypothetical protein|uniref:YARHG domain-containing protein n=1 Tax=Hyphomicrobium denitrificans 1NES1 TaxID=670307 RepID=N0B6X5_9HYPH|nr:hypothetical protein [Hyphomicrobium denitrificans]AGK58778.1 hypothetical protein HYPDE_35533 [Hyphomicrobium denitrificans 1NES1]